MEGNLFGRDIDEISKELMSRKELYSIRSLVDNKNWDDVRPRIIYPQAGSFSRFLINNYGLDKYKKVYQKLSRLNAFEENLKIIESSYEKSIEELERRWKDRLVYN
jgi:hypothetical protein